MLYHNVRVMGSSLRFLDAIATAAVCSMAWSVGVRLGLWQIAGTWDGIAVFAGVTSVSFVLLAARLQAYQPRRTEHLRDELSAIGEVLLYASAAGCLACQLFTRGLPGALYAAAMAINAAALLGTRGCMRVFIRRSRRRGQDYRVWLMIGHNIRTAQLLREIAANPHYGIRIGEVVDLPVKDSRGLESRHEYERETHGIVRSRVVENVEEIREVVAGKVIDEVLVTLPVRSYYDEIQRILDICCEAGISVKLPPEAFDRAGYRTQVSQLAHIPLVTHFSGPSNYGHLVMKRVIDIAGALAGLIVLSPLMALIALAVRLTSPGPVLFRQIRLGLHGRPFRILKFRSMVQDAEKVKAQLLHRTVTDGIAFKMSDDPRITAAGRILRRFHLDELPQLWNVLVGDMSLVGPRPLPPLEAKGNEWWHRRRLSVPPGLTCFWQVRGDHRMPFRQWAELDLAYIDGWSVWLDLKLIASTVSAVVRGKGW